MEDHGQEGRTEWKPKTAAVKAELTEVSEMRSGFKQHLPLDRCLLTASPSADSQNFLLVPDHWGWLRTVEKSKPQEQAQD